MGTPGRGSPPAWAEKLLRSVLPVGVVGESIRGDLDAEYDDFDGPHWLARCWYGFEAIKLAVHYRKDLGITEVVQDVRYGTRMLGRAPLVTAVAVLSLACGIAASTTMFATMYGFLYAPLPYADQEGLHTFRMVDRATGDERSVTSGNVLSLADQVSDFEAVAAWRRYQTTLSGVDEPIQIMRLDATPNVFAVLGRDAALGRTFAEDEGRPGDDRVGVLTHPLWERTFESDPDVVGRTLQVAGRAVTIVGVMPADFEFVPNTVGLVVARTFEQERDVRSGAPLITVATFVPGTTRERAEAQAVAVWERLAAEFTEELGRFDLTLETLREQMPSEADARLVRITLLVALFVLLIAAVNVANLLLARSEVRTREMAVRVSLGAGRARLLRQLLTEGVLLAVLSGVLGVVLAIFAVDQFAALWPVDIPKAFSPRAHPPVLAFTAVISGSVGIFFGLTPALQAMKVDQGGALRSVSRGGTAGRSRQLLRNGFVVAEIALAMALLAGAGSMMTMADSLLDVDLGLRSEGLLTFRTTASGTRYDDPTELVRFHRTIEEELLTLPGVAGVAVMDELPRGQNVWAVEFTIDGRDTGDASEMARTLMLSVNRDYFETMEVPLRTGRLFQAPDRADAPAVAVVSRTFAEYHFGTEDVLGRRITLRGASREIVGVVDDVFHSRVVRPGGLSGLAYLPIEQHPVRDVAYAVRTTGDPTAIAGDLRSAVWAIDANAAVNDVITLDDFIAQEMSMIRVVARSMGAFGILALLLSAIGIYGVMAHAVAQRQREIGIRLALGAEGRTVVGMVLRKGVAQALVGLGIGLPLALLIHRATEPVEVQFRASVGGPSVVIWVAALLGPVCLLASYLPARRAAGVDPVDALGSDG